VKARRRDSSVCNIICFLASMGFVLLADDAYAFMVAWENHGPERSYFLVTTQTSNSGNSPGGVFSTC